MIRFPMGSVVYWMDVFYIPSFSPRDLLPLAAALPYVSSVSDDLDSRGMYQVLTRSSLHSFSFSRFLTASLSGGLVLALARLMLILVLLWRLPFSHSGSSVFNMSYLLLMIEHQSIGLYLLSQCVFQFMIGFWSAGFSLSVAVLTNRRGVIYTFVTFMLLILSQIVGFPLLDFFSGVSSYFQDPAPAHQAHLLIIGIGAALSILSYSVFYLSLKRRVYE